MNVHYRIHNNPTLFPILSQMYPVHTLAVYFLKTLLILSFHLCLYLPNGFFPSGFLTKILYTVHVSYLRPTSLVLFILSG